MRTDSDKAQQAAASKSARQLEQAGVQAQTMVAEAKTKAERIRDDSERVLVAATQRRDSINAQLTNVRQMLATLSGGAMVNPPEPTESASAAEPAAEPAEPAANQSGAVSGAEPQEGVSDVQDGDETAKTDDVQAGDEQADDQQADDQQADDQQADDQQIVDTKTDDKKADSRQAAGVKG